MDHTVESYATNTLIQFIRTKEYIFKKMAQKNFN